MTLKKEIGVVEPGLCTRVTKHRCSILLLVGQVKNYFSVKRQRWARDIAKMNSFESAKINSFETSAVVDERTAG